MINRALKTVTAADMPQFSACMTAAFLSDPAARYIWPSAELFMRVFPDYAKLYQGPSIIDGTAWATKDFSGVITWLAPDRHPDEDKIKQLAFTTCPTGILSEVQRFFHELEQFYPSESCWYLPLIGVDPAYMGQGIGHDLMAATLPTIDASGKLAYLECSSPRNVAFYQRFGFQPIGEVSLGGRPISTPMIRLAK